VNASLDDAFLKMTKTKWGTFSQEVGGHSPYVSDIADKLSKQFEPVASHLSKIHYRFFCDKFVQAFVGRFIREIYKCGKISEQGAQQLLLDTALIKATLLEAPVVAGKGQKMQTAYSNYVLREMGRAETMLKVLSSPDCDAASVSALLGGDGSSAESIAEIERLLSLRATGDGDRGLNMSPRDEDGFGGSSGAAALGSAMVKDVKALTGDMKKNLQGRLGGLGLNFTGLGGGRKPAGDP